MKAATVTFLLAAAWIAGCAGPGQGTRDLPAPVQAPVLGVIPPPAPPRPPSPLANPAPIHPLDLTVDRPYLGDLDLKVGSGLVGDRSLFRPLVDSSVRYAGMAQSLHYSASYFAGSSDDVRRAEIDPFARVTAATPLGNEVVTQGLGARLPSILAAPVQIGVSDRYETRLSKLGAVETSTRSASASWAPAPAQVQVLWRDTTSADPPAFECPLGGSVVVPLGGKNAQRTLQFAGNDCQVAPRPGAAESLGVRAYSAGWHLADRNAVSAVHVRLLDPRAAPGAVSRPAYELGVRRTQTLGPFAASAAASLRRVAPPEAGREAHAWSAEGKVTRDVGTLAVSAHVQHAPETLWFVPQADPTTDQLGISLGFRRLLETRYRLRNVDLRMSYDWIRYEQDALPPDNAVRWNFSYRW